MKVRCVNCKSMIAIPDKKVHGKKGKVKVRCPSCNTVLGIHLKDREEEAEWYYAVDGERQGPLTMTGLLALVEAGTISAETLVWKPGFENWLPASSVEDIASHLSSGGAPVAHPSTTSTDMLAEQTVAGEAALEEPAAATLSALQQAQESLFPKEESAPSAQESVQPAPVEDAPQDAATQERQIEDMLLRQEAPAAQAEEPLFPREEPAAPQAVDEPIPADEPVQSRPEAAAEERQVEDLLFGRGTPSQAAEEPLFPQEQPAAAPTAGDSLFPAEEPVPEQASTARFSQPLAEEPLFPAQEERPRPAKAKPSKKKKPAADSGGGLFDGFDGGSEPEPSSGAGDKDGLLHSRRETSVLFSLDDLVQKDKGRRERKTDKHQAVDDSGLIDIRQVAMEQQSDDLFAGFGSKEPQSSAPAAITQVALSVPILKKRKRWPLALAATLGGIVLAAAAAYGVMTLTSAPGPEVIQQSIAMASEQALRQKSEGMLKLQEEYQARLDAARKTSQDARQAVSGESDKLVADARVERDRTLAEVRSRQEMRIGDLTNKLEAARKEAEERKKRVLLAANDTPPAKEEGGAPANGGAKAVGDKGAVAAPAEAKKTVKDEKKTAKTDAAKKEAAKKEAAKKEEAKKEEAKSESFVKEETKKEEVKKEEPVEEKAAGGKDAKALLAALDKKQEGNGEGEEGGAGASKKMLTTTEIMKVVNGNKPAMRECFDKYGAGLESATIRTKITIAGSGSVTSVTISSMEFAGTALGNCVKKVQMGMNFPAFGKPSLSKAISVRLP